MFDFTTTTFIHDADMIEVNPVNGNEKSSEHMLRLENKIFKYEDVVAIYRNPYIAPMNAKLVVDVTNFMKKATLEPYNGKRFKLDFYIRRSGDNNSFYSNDFVFKGKDFHYEWTNKQDTARKVAKMINKIICLYGDVYLKVYEEDDKLVFENDNYGWFMEAQLKVYVPELSDCCTYREGGWEVLDELTTKCPADGEYECKTSPQPTMLSDEDWLTAYQGVNGFGTYEQLLKDLRLPTMENFRWTSLNKSEMPIPGNKYVQYTIHLISCRGVLGGSAVGEVTHSKTTHVFFVPTCGCGDNGDLDQLMQDSINEVFPDKMVTTTEARNGGKIVDDPVNNPFMADDSIKHDPAIKANVVNLPEEESDETTTD